jgi:hypothetical protein
VLEWNLFVFRNPVMRLGRGSTIAVLIVASFVLAAETYIAPWTIYSAEFRQFYKLSLLLIIL